MRQEIQQYIENHKQICEKLHADYLSKSSQISQDALKELDLILEDDQEAQQEVVDRFNQKLHEILANYTQAITKANKQLTDAIEEISRSEESQLLSSLEQKL